MGRTDLGNLQQDRRSVVVVTRDGEAHRGRSSSTVPLSLAYYVHGLGIAP